MRRRQKIWRLTLQTGVSRLRRGQYSVRTCETQYRTAYLKRREVNCKEFPVHARKSNREVELELHLFLTSALDACVWSASREVQFIPRRKSPLSPLNRRRGGLQSKSAGFGKEENLQPYWTSNHNSSSVHPVP
jgi:hypothetical protein